MEPNQWNKIKQQNEETELTRDQWNKKIIEGWAKQQKEEIERSAEHYMIALHHGWNQLTMEQRGNVGRWKSNPYFKELVKQHQENLENQ